LEANVDTPIFAMTQGIEEQMEEHLDVDLELPLSMIVEYNLQKKIVSIQPSTKGLNTLGFKMWKLAMEKKNCEKRLKLRTIAFCQKNYNMF
jgi:hypothetical protein